MEAQQIKNKVSIQNHQIKMKNISFGIGNYLLHLEVKFQNKYFTNRMRIFNNNYI